MLDESNLHTSNRPDVAFVITKAFRNNPRQIKQFINTLIAHLLLAEHREISGELHSDIVTKHVDYLAKDLIIKLQFSKYYDSWVRGEIIDSSKELDDFLRATKPIDIDDNRAFRHLKLSEQEIEIPEIRNLQLAFQENNVDQASQIIDSFKDDKNKLSFLNKDVSSFINDNRGRGLILFNIVSSVLTTAKNLVIEFDIHFYHQVAELLNDDNQLGTRLQNFDLKTIFSDVLLRCDKSTKTDIIQKYLGLFSEPNNINRDDRDIYIRDLLQEFMEHVDWLNATRIEEIRNAIAQKHCNYEILSMFRGKLDKQMKFLHEDTLSKYIGEISESDIEETERLKVKIGLITEFKSIATDKNLSEISTQFTALLSTENTKL